MPPRVYLDHAAATPLVPAAFEAMARAAADAEGNPSSLHAEGQKARALLDAARERVAGVLGVRPREIVFTSGATEALDLAVRGLAQARAGAGRRVVATGIEHPAVLDPLSALAEEGFDVGRVPPRPDGTVDPEEIDRSAGPGTTLVAVMAVNHETGALLPVLDVAARVRPRRVAVVCDAALFPGFGDLPALAAGVDLLALSGPKFGGPKGIGALFVRRGVRVAPRQRGGPQEDGLRGGSENVLGAVGFAAALEAAHREVGDRTTACAASATRLLALLAQVEGVRPVGPASGVRAGFVLVEVEACEGEALLLALDLAGVAVATGSACAIGAAEPSPVLLAMGFSRRRAASTIRFTTGPATTSDEIDRVGAIFSRSVARLRALAR